MKVPLSGWTAIVAVVLFALAAFPTGTGWVVWFAGVCLVGATQQIARRGK